MIRLVLGLTVFIGLLLALNVNAYAIVGPILVLLIIAGAFIFMLAGKWPKHFLGTLALILIGPCLFCLLFSSLFAALRSVLGSELGSPAFLFALLIFGLISFLYVRWHLAHRRNPHRANELQTNERQPLAPPAQTQAEDELCAESKSSSASSGRD
jgi:hypothetical protein